MYLITIICSDEQTKALILDKLQDLSEEAEVGEFDTRVQEFDDA